MELLAGAGDARTLARLEKLVGGPQMLPVDAALDYDDAAAAFRAVRARGGTVRKMPRCLIAAVAVRTGAVLLHRDRDIHAFAAALPDLRVRALR